MYQKEGHRATKCQTQLLGYWRQAMTVFETMQEEEIKILSPLFLIIDSWLQALALYKPLDSSWLGGGHSSWGMSLPVSPLHQLRIKAIFQFPPNSVSVFFIRLRWAEEAKILASNSTLLKIMCIIITNQIM